VVRLECHRETSITRRPWLTGGLLCHGGKTYCDSDEETTIFLANTANTFFESNKVVSFLLIKCFALFYQSVRCAFHGLSTIDTVVVVVVVQNGKILKYLTSSKHR
jgi:hypothetical protein